MANFQVVCMNVLEDDDDDINSGERRCKNSKFHFGGRGEERDQPHATKPHYEEPVSQRLRQKLKKNRGRRLDLV